MSKGTIKYSEEFKSEFGNKWIGIDLVVNENDDWDKMYSEAESMVKKWGGVFLFSSSYSLGTVPYDSNGSTTIPSTPPPVIDRKAIERLEILIDDAKTIEELAIYKDDASKHGLVEQYMNRLKQLS